MKQAVKVAGFNLIVIGTVGLLITEFSLESWCTASLLTKVFAGFNCVGLATLAYAHWGMKSQQMVIDSWLEFLLVGNMRERYNWFFGFLGFLGFLGFIEPWYFAFFAFFLFFLVPLIKKSRKSN